MTECIITSAEAEHKWSFSLKEVDFDFLVPRVDE